MTNFTVVSQDFKLLSCLVNYFNTFSFTPLFRFHPVLSGKFSPNKKNPNIKALVTVLVMLFAYFIPTQAAITQRGTATSATTTSTTLTISKPTGVIAGDVMIVNITQTGNTGTNASLTGWTLIAGEQQSTGAPRRSTFLYRVADGTEGTSFAFTLGTGTTSAVGSVIAFSGVDVSVVFDVSPGAMSTGAGTTIPTTITATGITTVSANAAIVFLAGAGGTDEDTYSGWSGSTPTFSEVMDFSYSTGSVPNITYNSVGTAWGILTTPGATGDKTVSVDGNYYWAGILIALRPQLYYTVPASVYSLQVEVWGGGGRGGSCTTNGVGGGGGGGAYSRSVMVVTPGQVIPYSLGLGSSTTAAGGDTWFGSSTILMAKGGSSVADNSATGAAGGAASSGFGQVTYNGGNGATGVNNNNNNYGGGGGSSAGTAANGNAGSGSAGGIAPAGGGNGGNGATSNGNGSAGNIPGGGGGGARRGNNGSYTGGAGANGQITITPQITPFWLKADAGTSTTTDGAGVTSWNDQSGSANNGISPSAAGTGYTASTTNPAYASVLWNFNPGINFTNGYFRLNRGGIQDDMTFFTVYNSTQTSSATSWWLSPAIIGAEAAGTNNDFGIGHNAGILFFKGINLDPVSGFVQTSTNQNTGAPKIVTATRKKGTSATNYLYVNGTQNGSKTSDNNSLSDPAYIGIGRNPTQTGSQFTGGISEAIGKSYLVTTSERYATETYLAVKYGITLPYDYKRIHATDSIIYPVAGYGNDIAGLGRNNYYALNQKVSSSVNVASGSSRIVMATNNDFTSSNLDASRTALTDGQYLLWGHNNGVTNSWNNISDKNYKKVSRVWQARNTGNVGSVYFQIDLTAYPALPPAHFYALLVSSNVNFTGATPFYKLTKGSGSLYTTQPVFASGISYFTIAAIPNYWIGTQSTDWNTPGNWLNGVPDAGEDVEFATTSNNNSPAVKNLVVPAGVANSKTIGNLTNLTNYATVIPAGASLTVAGVVTGSSTLADAGKIQVKATTAAAPTVANGTLIINCTANSTAGVPKSIYATVDLFAKGKNGLPYSWTDNILGSPTDGKKTYVGGYRWQHFGVPVKEVVANPTFYGAYLRKYDETINAANSYYQKWVNLTNESKLEKFRGYEITQDAQDAPATYQIRGELVFCDQTITLTHQAPAVSGSTDTNEYNRRYGLGQNIFGNSFTASIPIDKINFPTDVEKVVYMYNTGTFGEWANTSAPVSETTMTAGTYIAIPKSTASSLDYGKIPSMQGFLLIHLGSTDAPISMQIPYADVAVNTKPQLSPKENGADTTGSQAYLKINLQSKSTIDNLWLFSREGTTNKIDDGWDGRKYFGTPTAFIYTENADGPMQVSTDKTIDGTVLSFYANEDTEYTLTLTKSNLDDYRNLHLIDLRTRTSTPLTEDVTTYHFTADSKGNVEKRFIIANSAFIDLNSDKFKLLDGYVMNNNRLIISNFTPVDGVMHLYDISGKTLINRKISSSVSEIPVSLQSGVYILSLQANGRHESIKLIIK